MRESCYDANSPDGIGGQFERSTSRATKSHGMTIEPALPVEVLLSHLTEFCIPRFACNSIQKDQIFQKIELRCEQIANACDVAELPQNISISINALVREFEWP
jgi:hypothetical protein